MTKSYVKNKIFTLLGGLGLLLLIAACGRVSLSLTDAPIDTAEAVVIFFTSVEITPTNGDIVKIKYPSPKSIDITTLVDGATFLLLDNESIPNDSYSGLELKLDIDSSYVTIDGSDFPLRIPAGSESGLSVTKNFEVKPGSSNRLIVDFDLRRSLYDPEDGDSDYVLRPKLRLVDESDTGTMSGLVDASLLSSETKCFDNVGEVTAVVYVFKGHSINDDDIDDIAPDPVTSAKVSANMDYTVAFMEEGDYTLSLTCEATDDDPATDDNISFLKKHEVSLIKGQVIAQDFSL